MTSPTMRCFVGKELVSPLKTLGRYDWLTWKQIDTVPPRTEIRLSLPLAIPLATGLTNWRQALERAGSINLLRPYMMSKALALGPKLLCPTVEECEALRQIEINVSHEEYEQPFPTLFVELPKESRDLMSKEFDWQCPRFVVIHHDKPTRYLFLSCESGLGHPSTLNIISPRHYLPTIEASIQLDCDYDGPDLRQAAALQRIACNFALLLTRFGAKECGPVDSAAHKKQSRLARSKNLRKATRAQNLLASSMYRIGFEQDIKFFDVRDSVSTQSGASGTSKRTHWRRGHFRRQRCGVGRSERRLVFVKPCLINSSSLEGDLADTEYRIRTSAGVIAKGVKE